MKDKYMEKSSQGGNPAEGLQQNKDFTSKGPGPIKSPAWDHGHVYGADRKAPKGK